MTGPMIGTIGDGLRVVAPPVERRGPAAFAAAS